jgi:Ser/Thr protein kinase RdoA (MazF antagonist)
MVLWFHNRFVPFAEGMVINMIKIIRSVADAEALKELATEKYAIKFNDFALHRDVGGAIYFTSAAQKHYVFKLSRAEYADKAERAVNILNYLQQFDFPSVRTISTKDGLPYINVEMPEGIRTGSLFEYIEGSNANLDNVEEIGEIAARLHNVLHEYDGNLPHLYEKQLLLDDFIKITRSLYYDTKKTNEMEEIIDDLWEKIKYFPIGVVHGDFDIGNVIKQSNGLLILIDFDNVGYMPIIYDLVCHCNKIDYFKFTANGVSQTKETLTKFLNGYNKVNPDFKLNLNDAFNWIAVKRIEMQANGMRILMPVQGRQGLDRFLNATYDWLKEWKNYFVQHNHLR